MSLVKQIIAAITAAIRTMRLHLKQLMWRRVKTEIKWLPEDNERMTIMWSLLMIEASLHLSEDGYHALILSMIDAGLLPGVTPDYADQKRVDDLINLIKRKASIE